MKARIARYVCIVSLLVIVGSLVFVRIWNSRYPLTPDAAKQAIITLLKEDSPEGSVIDIFRASTLESVIDAVPKEDESGIVWIDGWRCDLQERRFTSPLLSNPYNRVLQIGGGFSQNFDGTWSARVDTRTRGHGPLN